MEKKRKKYTFYSKEEKLKLVKRRLEGESLHKIERETGISNSMISRWVREYIDRGEEALINKKKPGNPLSLKKYREDLKYAREKELKHIEELERKVAIFEMELLKKDEEIAKLKRLIEPTGSNI